jgi:hypothetical protein
VKRKFSIESGIVSSQTNRSTSEDPIEQSTTPTEEGHNLKRPRHEEEDSVFQTSWIQRQQPQDPLWEGTRMTSLLAQFDDLSTKDIAEVLAQRISTSRSNLGTRIYGLEDCLESFDVPSCDRVLMVLSEEAVSVPPRPILPLPFTVKIGMAFWERAVAFSLDKATPLGDTAAGSADGKITTKWRLHIVRAILRNREFLTTYSETHGGRGLHVPYIPRTEHWQWLRLADSRDRNPVNDSDHKGVLRLDTSLAGGQPFTSDMSYVFAGRFYHCSLTKYWQFAGYLDEDSVILLETIGDRVTKLREVGELHDNLYDSINWDAIDKGRNRRGLHEFSRPVRRTPPRQTETPRSPADDTRFDIDRRRTHQHPRSDDRLAMDYQDSSREASDCSNDASYEKDQSQRTLESDARSA